MSPENEYEYDVFISYSHADSVWVRGDLLTRLEEARLRVCIDYHLTPSTSSGCGYPNMSAPIR